MDGINMDVQALVANLTTIATTWGLKVIGAIIVVIVGRILASSARKAIKGALERRDTDPTLVPYVSGLAYYALMTVILVAVLGMVGIQTASILTVLGAAGLAVGLALQGTLSNFAAGVMLLAFRPFRVGDYIEGGGTTGSVQNIGLFATTLHTPDNVQIITPNSSVFGSTIKNYTANATRRNDMVIGVSYDDDLSVVKDTIEKVLKDEPRVLEEPAPVVAVSELGDSSVNFVVRPWCTKEDYWNLRFELMRRLKEELETAGCSIPFPQRDVHLFQETAKVA